MEIHKNHYIELYVHKQQVELKSQNSLNLRINNVVFDPTKVVTTTGEYSYSFKIPATPNNNKIFGHANALSKINKFQARYDAQVYSDSNLIFDGSLTVRKYNAKDKEYECNLVNFKINTLDEIFGEETLPQVEWMVDFSGGTTIQSVNQDPTSKFWFPLVSYGAFQKSGKIPDDWPEDEPCPPEDMEYTPKSMIDNSNIETLDTFWPSLNLLEEVKKCFEHKGYSVGGDAYTDPILNNIYCSTNIAEDQNPEWNVGLPKFGRCDIRMNFKDWDNSLDSYLIQDLKYPYHYVGGAENGYFNFNDIFYKNLLNKNDNCYGGSNYFQYDKYQRMYNSSGGYIQIPADGFYKVSLSGDVRLLQTNQLTADQYIRTWIGCGQGMFSCHYFCAPTMVNGLGITPKMQTTTPIEIQLVKNYDDNIELIKGKYNWTCIDGNSSNETYIECDSDSGELQIFPNKIISCSCYPHEALGREFNDYVRADNYAKITKYDKISDSSYNKTPYYGYAYESTSDIMVYDPVVSEAFICGISTMGAENDSSDTYRRYGGQVAFIKDGYSWSKTNSTKNDALYKEYGYCNVRAINSSGFPTQYECSDEFNENWLPNAPSSYFTRTSISSATASVNGMVYLKKDDILQVMLVKHGYWNGSNMVHYTTSGDVTLSIEAVSPRDINALRYDNYGWNSPIEFPTQLNLMNFTNAETKVSDWLKNVQTAFNLNYDFQGNSVDISTNKGTDKFITAAINIDDRVSSDEAESSYINYPREMAIKYRIDTEERGFYESVPANHINDRNWKDYGDSGFTSVILNTDTYETNNQIKSTQFSYTWYKPFTYSGYCMIDTEYSSQFVLGSGTTNIPIISKDEYMIDGFDDYESMKHRGYQLPQRFWFRTFEPLKDSNNNNQQAQLEDDWDGNLHHNMVIISHFDYFYPIDIYAPSNVYNGVNLSYKDSETSLLTNYFNIYPMLSSNYVTVEAFINPTEYIQLKGGALVHYDSDLYYTSEISGFDPSGGNTTKLKLIKRT